MAVYRFRVTFEDYDDVSRDIEIKATQTFDDLHYGLHNYIGFDASKPASFFMSDDYWKKGKEISNRELKGEDKVNVTTFRNARLCDFIIDPHQKIVYIFDPEEKWTFHIELLKIVPVVDGNSPYPKCIKSTGEAPKQYPPPPSASLPQPEDFDPAAVAEPEEEAEPEVDAGVDDEDIPVGVEEVKVTGEGELVGDSDENSEEETEDEDEIL